MTDLEDLVQVDQVLEQERKNRRALTILLDKERERNNHLLALRCNMGLTKSYLTSVSLEWIEQKVNFATELPIFKEYIDPETGQVKLNEVTASMIQQRTPDFSRQLQMTYYLACRPSHKFPPILAVLTQPWVDDLNADQWSSDGIALQDSVAVRTLDSAGDYVDLEVSEGNDIIYAIDGQHRLMAIQGLKKLLSEGHLFSRDSAGKEKTTRISVDEIIQKSNGRMTRAKLQTLMGERIGIEIIPAVLRGESRDDALRRLRSIFVHVNKTAKALSASEIALLDEDNGFAVVARTVAASHPLLKAKVNLKKGQLPESSPFVTTLETLVNCCKWILEPRYPEWSSEFGPKDIPIRPPDDEIEEGITFVSDILNHLAQVKTFDDILMGHDPADYRRLGDGPGHLLLRPLGQLALFRALHRLIYENGMELDEIFQKISESDEKGLFKCDDPKTPWYGSSLDPIKGTMRRTEGAQKLSADLLVHVIGGGTPIKELREALTADFREFRIVDLDERKVHNFKGKKVDEEKLGLPSPW